MQSLTHLVIFLAVALMFANNASAQAYAQSSASASAYSSSGINEPVVIEIETPEDHQDPPHVKDVKHHVQGPVSQPVHHSHPVEDQENSWQDATYEGSPSGEAYDSSGHYSTKTVADESQDSDSNGTRVDPYSAPSGSYQENTSHASGGQYATDMGPDDVSSYSSNQSDDEVNPDVRPHGHNHISEGKHEKTSSTGKDAASNQGDQAPSIGSSGDDDFIRAPMFEYPDKGEDGETFDDEGTSKNHREKDDDDEIYPTRTTGTSTSYSPGPGGNDHPAGYLGVPTGEQPYCQGPLDPETGKGIIDINGRCTIVCYNNLVLNRDGDNCICPPNLHLDPSHSRCICHSPYVLSGGKCVLPPSQRAKSSHQKRSMITQIPMGEELLHGKYLRTEKDRVNCPASEIACPLPSGDWECLDPEFTLDSCGGCASDGTGVDCWALEGVQGVGCDSGSCLVFSCLSDYKLVDGTCVPRKD